MKKLFLLIVVTILPISVFAQGRIIGKITDQNGLAVSDITVRIRQDDSFWKGCITNNSGFFVIDDVPTGSYSIAAYKKGIIQTKYDNVEVYGQGAIRFDMEVKSLKTNRPAVANQRQN